MPLTEKQAPLSLRDWIGLFAIVGGGLIAWGTLTADFRALAQRVDKSENRDGDNAKALNALNGAVIELRGDAKGLRVEQDRQGRQLDRIEQILRDHFIPAPPTKKTTP